VPRRVTFFVDNVEQPKYVIGIPSEIRFWVHREKTVRYFWNGQLSHISFGQNNKKYSDGQRIGIEVDMTTVPRRVTFFVDNVEQPKYVIGIPSEIRFWVLTKFERLIKSSAKGVEGSKALEWGKEW
ncbi:MAG: hypothetical protein EZS28_047313, partial [Streblomastix strix]